MKPSESQPENQENQSSARVRSPRKWQRLLLILLPVVLTIGGIAILWRLLARDNKSPSSTTVQQKPLQVELAEVQAGQIKESSEFIASLQSLRSASLKANTQGKVSQVFVKNGSQVAAQAPLLLINPNQPAANNRDVVNTTLQIAQKQLQNARTQLQELEAQHLFKLQNVRLNQQKYEKYSSLASQGAISKQTKDEYAQRLEAAKLEFNNLDAKITAQQVAVSKLEKDIQTVQLNTVNKLQKPKVEQKLQQYKISAPFKGTVGNLSVKVGDIVNSQTRVATVNQNQPLEADIPVDLDKKSQLRKRMTIEIINTKGESIGSGRIFFISPEVNQNTRTILVKALFENTEGKMEAGQFAKARINWNQHSGLLIPASAVFRIAGKAFVYVAEKFNSTAAAPELVAKQKQVKLGKIIDNNYQVIEGLQPGERVVVSKLMNIKDGEILMAQ